MHFDIKSCRNFNVGASDNILQSCDELDVGAIKGCPPQFLAPRDDLPRLKSLNQLNVVVWVLLSSENLANEQMFSICDQTFNFFKRISTLNKLNKTLLTTNCSIKLVLRYVQLFAEANSVILVLEIFRF